MCLDVRVDRARDRISRRANGGTLGSSKPWQRKNVVMCRSHASDVRSIIAPSANSEKSRAKLGNGTWRKEREGGVGVPGCEGPSARWTHFQAGQHTVPRPRPPAGKNCSAAGGFGAFLGALRLVFALRRGL